MNSIMQEHAIKARMFTRDHIEARKNGGTNDIKNLKGACILCNNMKSAVEHTRFAAFIASMCEAGIHPHQIFDRTGIWMRTRGDLHPYNPITRINP